MTISISLPDALRDFLEEEMQERGHESLEACAAFLLQQAQQFRGPRRTFLVDGQTYRLTRLSDSQENDSGESSIAIKESLDLQIALSRASDLDLAEIYAVCRHLFGERGRGFDDWKGGFAFPLALDVPRAPRRPAYLFRVVNYRSGVEYGLRRLVDPADKRLKNPVYYPPDAAEFSRAEIDAFTTFFVGFLEGYFEWVKTWWKDRFLLAVESNLILYGFDGEKFFTRRFKSPKTFEKARVALAKRLPTPGFYSRDGASPGGNLGTRTGRMLSAAPVTADFEVAHSERE